MKNILVTGAGAVLGQGILRCLQEYANDFIIHTADPDHKSSGHWLGNKAHIVKMANDPEYINSIENIIQQLVDNFTKFEKKVSTVFQKIEKMSLILKIAFIMFI